VAGVAALLLLSDPPRFASQGERPDSKRLFYREGVSATVAVLHGAGRPDDRVMSVDGVVIAATQGLTHQKQQELAHLPFLLAPGLARGLTIGLGSGIVLAEMARHPGLERVRCVEIAPEVVEGAAHFAEFTGGVLSNPRVEVVVDDGIQHLRRTQEAFDVIVSDAKSQPRHAGNAAFFSRDFYQSALAHLAPGGLFVQWVPLHMPGVQYRTVVRTFLEAFPHAYVWLSPPGASFLIGTRERLRLDPGRMEAALREPAYRGLRRLGWLDGEGVVGFFVADAAALGPRLGPGPTNTLERPVLEFYGLRDYDGSDDARQRENRDLLLEARRALALESLVEAPDEALRASWRAAGEFARARWSPAPGEAPRARIEAALRDAPGSRTLRGFAARFYQDRALALLARLGGAAPGEGAELAQRAEELLRQPGRLAPGDFDLALALAADAAERLDPPALAALDGLARAHQGWTELPLLLAGRELALGRFDAAAELLARVLAADPSNVDARAAFGFLLTGSPLRDRLGDPAQGLRMLEEAHRDQPDNPAVLHNYAIALFLAGDPGRARALIDRAVALAPEHAGLRLTQRRIHEGSPPG
jgi:spermidine synthase